MNEFDDKVGEILSKVSELTVVELRDFQLRVGFKDEALVQLINASARIDNVFKVEEVKNHPEGARRKIQAIKIIREHLDTPLKESKEFADGVKVRRIPLAEATLIQTALSKEDTGYRLVRAV